MGTLSVAGALASVFLPETLNIHLPQTVEEGEAFGANFKLFSQPWRNRATKCDREMKYCPTKELPNGKAESLADEVPESLHKLISNNEAR
ncbi:hypothetical protein Cfor_02606 [Coptotermes formosanus]|uniref:Uncharacterized protein n=1 Tax=Coptotermes formosanus TaxID=36987 RepID=A0A6L2PN90_COPFO|nr:hypothetical protein Cfor_02606 [Coptotermes formosanus]